jgi:hypothetical protein
LRQKSQGIGKEDDELILFNGRRQHHIVESGELLQKCDEILEKA